MTATEKIVFLSVDEYLRTEAESAVKREYVDGQVFVMDDTNIRHNLITGNLYAAIRTHIKMSKCNAFVGAVKVRLEAANCFYYPDVMVSCDSFDETSVYTENPVLVMEVLSPSTASTDRREKRVNYMKLESLQELVFVHQTRKCVELQRRNSEGYWEVSRLLANDTLILKSLPNGVLNIAVSDIYADIFYDPSDKNDLEVNEDAIELEFSLDATPFMVD